MTPVTVPFSDDARMLEAVKVALFHERCQVDYRRMSGPDDYHDLVKALWHAGHPFIINEHDVIPWPGAIKALDECSIYPWCTFAYRAPSGWVSNGLGLVKFDPRLLPNIFAERFQVTHWRNLDMQIARRLEAKGFRAHVHNPAVSNLNPSMWFVEPKAA